MAVYVTIFLNHIGILVSRYNIRYGNVDAGDADIIAAAKSADIHERILAFPDLYNTQVL